MQKELESECGCPHNCYSQLFENEMYSIQLQMSELKEPECDMHISLHPASNIWHTLNCYFSKLSFLQWVSFREYNFSNDKHLCQGDAK